MFIHVHRNVAGEIKSPVQWIQDMPVELHETSTKTMQASDRYAGPLYI